VLSICFIETGVSFRESSLQESVHVLRTHFRSFHFSSAGAKVKRSQSAASKLVDCNPTAPSSDGNQESERPRIHLTLTHDAILKKLRLLIMECDRFTGDRLFAYLKVSPAGISPPHAFLKLAIEKFAEHLWNCFCTCFLNAYYCSMEHKVQINFQRNRFVTNHINNTEGRTQMRISWQWCAHAPNYSLIATCAHTPQANIHHT